MTEQLKVDVTGKRRADVMDSICGLYLERLGLQEDAAAQEPRKKVHSHLVQWLGAAPAEEMPLYVVGGALILRLHGTFPEGRVRFDSKGTHSELSIPAEVVTYLGGLAEVSTRLSQLPPGVDSPCQLDDKPLVRYYWGDELEWAKFAREKGWI